MEAAFLITTAELILKLLIPTAAGKAISIWNNEDEIQKLSDTIEYIGAVLYDAHGRKYEDLSVNDGYKRLRRAYLDAQDFLDRVETIKRKRDADTRNMKKEEEEIINGKGKCSLAFVCIKTKPIHMKTVRFFSSSNQAKYALEMNNVIKRIRTNLDAISQDIQKYGLREVSSNSEVDPRTGRASGPYSDQINKPIGRDRDIRRIVNLILKPHVADQKKIPWISIVGIGGIGKTTVAQLVYVDKFLLETCKFDMKLWVSDSKKYNFRSLLKHILKSICSTDTSLDTLEEDQLSTRLVDGIRGKTFLIVLDDVEDKSYYIVERLEILLNYGSNESRVLITTRSRKVANDVGSSELIYELQGLSQEDSLQLFERYAFRQQKRDERLVQIANLIARKCWGVSLYIKVVGSYLYGEGIEKWEEVRDESFARVADDGNPLMLIWKSYHGLDSTVKHGFSLCAIFEQNYAFSKEDLTNIWMDNIRFKTRDSKVIKDECDRCLRTLYDRCFLQLLHKGDEVEYWTMHDLMHDLAKEVAGEEILLLKPNELMPEDVRHLIVTPGASQTLPEGRRIRTLLLKSPVEDGLIVSNYPVLRLLNLRSCGIENLTDSIGKLIHLRCLILSGNNLLLTLPHSICDLINLRHLDLAHCHELTHLPSGLGALTSLQVLDLYECRKLEGLPRGTQNLANLRRLTLQKCQLLTRLPCGIGALASLKILNLDGCGKLEELPNSIENLISLEHLNLNSCSSLTRLPEKMGALTSLKVLEISCCTSLLQLPRGLERLRNLRRLNWMGSFRLYPFQSGMCALLLVSTPAIFIVGDPRSENTVQLEELGDLPDLPPELVIYLHYIIKPRTPSNGQALLVNQKSLRKLALRYQYDHVIEALPDDHLAILEKLQPHSNLEELELERYQGIAFPAWMPKDGFAFVLPNLVSLLISHCTNCVYLLPVSRLPCLRILRLDLLSSLEYIEEENCSDATYCLPKLEQLELVNLSKVRGWYRGEAVLPALLPRLSRLVIVSCPNLTVPSLVSVFKPFELENDASGRTEDTPSPSLNLFAEICINDSRVELSLEEKDCLRLKIEYFTATQTPSHMDEAFTGMCRRLTHLEIHNCIGLKTLPGSQHLAALLELRIVDCCDFTGEDLSVEGDSAYHHRMLWKGLQSLQRLFLEKLPKMLKLPDEIQFLASLECISIMDCRNLLIPEWLHKSFQCIYCNSYMPYCGRRDTKTDLTEADSSSTSAYVGSVSTDTLKIRETDTWVIRQQKIGNLLHKDRTSVWGRRDTNKRAGRD